MYFKAIYSKDEHLSKHSTYASVKKVNDCLVCCMVLFYKQEPTRIEFFHHYLRHVENPNSKHPFDLEKMSVEEISKEVFDEMYDKAMQYFSTNFLS